MLTIAVIVILLAFAFTFTNGFQDASSIAATFIASRSATPRQGIIFVAALVLLGALMGGSAVAFTLSGLLAIEPSLDLLPVLLAALLSAITWNLLTWRFGLPSSSTHALVGGLVGAGIAAAGMDSISWGFGDLLLPPHELTGLAKILIFLVLSVALGFIAGYLMEKVTKFLLRNAKRRVNRSIISLNWAAAGAMAFANGANDAQKQMGIIALALLAAGYTAVLDIPLWARAGCALLLGLGTLGGGWRIMTTLGRRIFSVKPIHSFNSQVASGAAIAVSTFSGAPISSTHIISLSVLGVGAAENPKKVHWAVARDIVTAMLMTIPVTLVLAAAIWYAVTLLIGG
jgi:PiT family inorganic phosphate transporter